MNRDFAFLGFDIRLHTELILAGDLVWNQMAVKGIHYER